MEIPNRYHCTTGDQDPAYEMIDDFFTNTKAKSGLSSDFDTLNFEIRVCTVCRYGDQPSDDKQHLLLYKQQVIATVTETRTELNNMQFDFFQNLEGIVE